MKKPISAQNEMFKWVFWKSVESTFGLIIALLFFLFIFGTLIAYYEAPHEIEENRRFRDLITRISANTNISSEDLDFIIAISERDPVRGIEGFSTFDPEKNDWSAKNAQAFFGATSYAFDLASTIGYGSFTAKTIEGRSFSILCIIILFPIAVVAYTRFADFVYNFVANVVIKSNSKYRAVMDRYDAQKSGTLNSKELYLIFQDLNLQVTSEQCEKILKQYDTNHDEVLDESEFRQLAVDLNIKVGLLTRQYFQIEFAIMSFILYNLVFTLITYFSLHGSKDVVNTNFDFFDSFYFVMITVSTVGLGDIVPPHRYRAPFSLLAFIGIGFTALLFKAVVDKVYERTDLRRRYFRRALAPVFELEVQETSTGGKVMERLKSVRLVKEELENAGEDTEGEVDQIENPEKNVQDYTL